MKIKPLNDQVLVEPIKEENVTKGGIVIPESVDKERPTKGKVISVGPGKLTENGERLPMSVKEGDVILFRKYAPDEIKIDEKEYYFIKESDILAIIEE